MAASSQKFELLLERLKLPEDCKLAQDTDVEWMWADPHCAAFLDWITENLNRSNVITPSQRQQFEILSQQGHVLSGKHLNEALHAVDSLDRLSEEELDQRIKSMSVASEKLHTRKARLQQMSNDISQKIAQTELKVDSLNAPIEKIQKDLGMQLQRCEDQHIEFQESLTNLRDVIQNLHLVYSGSDRDSSKLLCHTDLQPLYEAEQSYNTALAQFTDRRFIDGLANMAGEQQESCYQLIRLSDPQVLSLKQGVDEKMAESCAELNRLRHVHCVSLQQNVEARVNSAMCESACETLENSSSSIDELEKLSLEQLRNHLERVKGKLAIYNRELSSVRDLTSLIERTTSLKEAYILTGDYNLKITRQQYFLSCQQQVIDKLVDQRARNELLTMMFEVEMEDVQQTRHILAAITVYLQQLVSASKHRLAVLEDAEILSHKCDRTVIDSRDVLLNAVGNLLEKESTEEHSQSGKVLTSYKELVSSSKSFIDLHKEKISTSNSSSAEKQLTNMKETSDACFSELMLTSGCDIIDSLSPKEISERVSEMKAQLKLLQMNIKTIMSTITQKRKLLAGR